MNDNVNSVDKSIENIERDSRFFIALKDVLYHFIKRSFDIIIALIGCLFLIPITIIVKICYILSGDYEKIIFSQDRIGLEGKIFKLYKFRSMIPDADKTLEIILKKDKKLAKEYKTNKKLVDDPRITKIGKFLRKTSLDEIPQFINILKGDMSLIGNRPYLPREKKDMGKYYESIIQTKPGLTGYWQVSGRSNTTFKKRCELESYYSNNYSLGLDIKIFFKTFKEVFKRNGAK